MCLSPRKEVSRIQARLPVQDFPTADVKHAREARNRHGDQLLHVSGNVPPVLDNTRTPLKLTCTLTTVRPEDIDVLDVAIWLKQGPQLLLGDIPGDLHRSEGVSWSSNTNSKTPTAADVPLAGTVTSIDLYYKYLK